MMRLARRYLSRSWDALTTPPMELWRHRDLVRLLVRRDLQVRTAGTLLGWLWLLLQPTLQILAFLFLFKVVFRVRFPGYDVSFFDYFLIGMIPWLFLSENLNRSLGVLREFGPLYRRVRFPLPLLPLVPLLVSGMVYGLIFVVAVIMVAGAGAALAAVPVFASLLLWLIPAVYLLAVIGLFLRDLGNAFRFFLTMIFYVTPILYVPTLLPDWARELLILNPFADIMAVLHNTLQDFPATPGNFLRPWLLWALALGPCWVLFKRAEPHVREVL